MNTKNWVPIPGTAKARLLELALRDFGARGFEGVNVVELAAEAGVTTGSLYHHFENKLGLYGVVRDEIEQRVLDRMAGAAAGIIGAAEQNRQAPASDTSSAAVRAALLVGFDATLKQGAARLLSEPDPRAGPDRIAALLAEIGPADLPELAPLLAAAWRAALTSAAARPDEAQQVRRALERLARG